MLSTVLPALAGALPSAKSAYYHDWFLRNRTELKARKVHTQYHVGFDVVEATYLFLLRYDSAYPCKVTIAKGIGVTAPADNKPKPVQRALRALEALKLIE